MYFMQQKTGVERKDEKFGKESTEINKKEKVGFLLFVHTAEEADANSETAASAETEGRAHLPKMLGFHHGKLPHQPLLPFFSLLFPFHASPSNSLTLH